MESLRRSREAIRSSEAIFFLSRPHRVIFIGLAAEGTTIRTRTATEFEYDCSPKPRALYHFYLESYSARSGGLLPECNGAD